MGMLIDNDSHVTYAHMIIMTPSIVLKHSSHQSGGGSSPLPSLRSVQCQPAPLDVIYRIHYMCLDWCTFFGDHVGPIGTVFFSYVFILISISIPTFENNRAKSALVSDLPKTSNNNIKTFFSSKNRILFFPKK
jgi:hypothetical protein